MSVVRIPLAAPEQWACLIRLPALCGKKRVLIMPLLPIQVNSDRPQGEIALSTPDSETTLAILFFFYRQIDQTVEH